jgi:hypothetical protein
LLVVARAENNSHGNAMWLCECDCGNTVIVCGCNLRDGHTQSCGCLKSIVTAKRNFVDGKAMTRLHNVWKQIKQRCTNPNNDNYKNYGGRGITMCQEWQDSFQAFYDYVSNLPHFNEKGRSIDRINNNGNYEPNNIRWATAHEQNLNQRRREKND